MDARHDVGTATGNPRYDDAQRARWVIGGVCGHAGDKCCDKRDPHNAGSMKQHPALVFVFEIATVNHMHQVVAERVREMDGDAYGFTAGFGRARYSLTAFSRS